MGTEDAEQPGTAGSEQSASAEAQPEPEPEPSAPDQDSGGIQPDTKYEG